MDETTGGRRRGEADGEESGTEYGHSATSRRQFLRAAGASAVATGAGTGLGTAQTATPTGVPAPVENLRISNRGSTELTVRWDDSASYDLDRLELRWSDARSGDALPPGDERVSGSENVEPHEDVKLLKGLDSGVPYEFEVRAVDVDGHASEWASIVARTSPAPTNFRVSGMALPSLTLAWDRPYDDWDGFDLTGYEVSVEGGPTRTVDASVGSVTVDEFPTDGHREVEIAGIDAAGERTATETITPTVDAGDGSGSDRVVDGPRTHLGSGVGDYVAGWLGEVRSGSDFDRASVTVADGTVWIRGRIHVGYHDSRPAFVTDATFDGDRLHVVIGYEGGDEPAEGTIAYQAGLDVDRRPSEVVVHHPNPYAASWTEDGPGGTVVPVVTRRNPDADRTVGGALLLPNWTDGVTSGRVEVSVPDSFASLEVEPYPADVDATVEADGDAWTVTFDAPAGEDALAESDDVLGPSDFRYETGTVLARFSVRGSEPGVATVDVTDASLTAPTGEDVAQGAASTDFRIDPRFEVSHDYPYDLDRDGLYEDLNGNGKRDLADAVTLYQERDRAAVVDHSRYFDFSGNGEVDLADVVQLFQENAG